MSPEEMELRIKRLENLILNLSFNTRIYIGGICFNASLHDPPIDHPHYTEEPQIDWSRPIIYLRSGV